MGVRSVIDTLKEKGLHRDAKSCQMRLTICSRSKAMGEPIVKTQRFGGVIVFLHDQEEEFGVHDDRWIVAGNEEEALHLACGKFPENEIVELSQDLDVLVVFIWPFSFICIGLAG
ncbi:hypothetical protein A4A49_51550 [Nicotiana attenuata]|uniref:Uncharacterized protein n=1 Tax=Nicotiana attenuata TaxID=49451 RepID=A0A1J6IPV7_NICAT|nr:hypothetical protein A4A49_51550 [Nicotiana attenuata]